MANFGHYGMPNPANFQDVNKGAVTYTNLDKILVMSPSEMGRLVRIKTPNGYGVRLPDARQLAKFKTVTIVNLSNTSAIDITDNNGNLVKTCLPNTSVVCQCTSISTSSGVWTAKQFGAGAMSNIAYGAATVLSANNADLNSICPLTPTSAIVFYRDVTNANYPTAQVITVNGTTISYGTSTVVNSSGAEVGAATIGVDSICALSSTSVFVAYKIGTTTYGQILTISGTTITPATASSISTLLVGTSLYAVALSASTVVVLAQAINTNYYMTATAITVSGTTLTIGALTTLDATNALGGQGYSSIAPLSSTSAVLTYANDSNYYLFAQVITVSGTTITVGSAITLVSADNRTNQSICALNSTTAVAFYSSASSSYYPVATILNISGTTVTSGNSYTLISVQYNWVAICALDTATMLVLFSTGSSGNNYAAVITKTGATLAIGSLVTLNTTAMTFDSLCTMDSKDAIAFYRDVTNANKPTAIALTIF